jgi:hypothetical protein
MSEEIKKGNLNYDQSGRAYPDNPEVKENWDCIWEKDGKHYKLVGDNEHKEWEEVRPSNETLYSEIEHLIIQWNNDGTKTAGSLTRDIMKVKTKINKEELYKLYMEWVEQVTEECDWKTSFGPEEIVGAIATILENNPHLYE